MRTILKIAAVVIVLLVVAGGIFYFLHRSSGTAGNGGTSTNPFGTLGGTQTPGGTGTTATSTPQQTIYTSAGKAVSVPAFTADKSSVPLSNDSADLQYNLTPYPPYTPGQTYPSHQFDVQYNSKTSVFIVTLNEEPLSSARLGAEAYLRDLLKLSNKQLCTLNVNVTVPYEVNPQYADYKTLGMSFCSGAAVLP